LETAIQALRQGADGLLLKPFAETKELVESIQKALIAREHKREVSRLQAIRPLIQITQSLFAETRPDQLVDLILDAICSHLECKHAGFYRRKYDEKYLALVSGRGDPLPGDNSELDSGPIGRTDAWGVPLRVSIDTSVGEDPGLQTVLEAHHYKSVMCAPALRSFQGHSVLFAAREQREPNFSDSDFEMFAILARQASVALENAQLYAELRDYIQQVEESQRALIQAEKMAAIGRLTASIAHEVNNPLQSVRNCLHLVSRKDLNAKKREHYLGMALEELERLMQTMGQMLDFYRPGAVSKEITNIDALVKSVLRLLEKQLKKQNIEVKLNIDPETPDVYVVSNQIKQVFFNIVLNAMEAMTDGGLLYINSYISNQGVEITFEDTGPGVPEDYLTNIFEPFMSTKDKGTGLGLSVSYNILEAHGGRLELVDGRGDGACFRVTLPLVEILT